METVKFLSGFAVGTSLASLVVMLRFIFKLTKEIDRVDERLDLNTTRLTNISDSVFDYLFEVEERCKSNRF